MTVFEAMNRARKEILVGATPLPFAEFIAAKETHLAAEVPRWRATEEVFIRCLSENMPVEDARQFVSVYVFCVGQGDWRIIRQSRHPGP